MERGDADDMIHTNHSSDSQRSDEEGDLKTHGDNSGGNRWDEVTRVAFFMRFHRDSEKKTSACRSATSLDEYKHEGEH